MKSYVARCRANPGLMDELKSAVMWDDELYERGQRRVAMTDEELTAHLHELYPEERFTEPRFWRDERFNNPLQPVVGVCWYEVRAYCAWLWAQTGLAVRLPTEVEWEAAARGQAGRRYAYGDEFDVLCGNTVETRLKRPTPVGVFVEGDTPEGVSDLTGNSFDWTSSLFGGGDATSEEPEYGYPYDAVDGREDANAAPDVRRVSRGGGWNHVREVARAACRGLNYPADWDGYYGGCRVVVLASSPIL